MNLNFHLNIGQIFFVSLISFQKREHLHVPSLNLLCFTTGVYLRIRSIGIHTKKEELYKSNNKIINSNEKSIRKKNLWRNKWQVAFWKFRKTAARMLKCVVVTVLLDVYPPVYIHLDVFIYIYPTREFLVV